MKKIAVLLFIPLFVLSCDNEPNQVTISEPVLTLKEVNAIQTSSTNTSVLEDNFFYDQLGQTILYESSYAGTDEFYYLNGKLDSIYNNLSFEPGHAKYIYQNNILTNIKHNDQSGVSGADNYNISYNNNIITIDLPTGNSAKQITCIFSDNNYNLLLQEKWVFNPANNSTTRIIDYEYDSNSNRTSKTRKRLNNQTQTFDIESIENFTYDNMQNPYKNTATLDIVLLRNLYTLPSRALLDDKTSSNNIISSSFSSPSGSFSNSTYDYEYNDLGYPISSIRTTISTNSSGVETTRILEKTFIYN